MSDDVSQALGLPMTQADYMATKGVQCPYCRSVDLDANHTWNNEDGTVKQSVGCNACGRKFVDTYTLASYEADTDE